MSYRTLETQSQRGVALIWLNRPELRNAMNPQLIAELTDAVAAASDDDEVRAVVLCGRGSAFCAGADLNWMKSAADSAPADNAADAAGFAALLRAIADCPKPTVARVHGPAYAAGMGLVAACDIAIAGLDAKFCVSEVRIGLIPAVISPYVIGAMGRRAAQRYFLTGEAFGAAEAYRIGFVHELVPDTELDAKVDAMLGNLLVGGPHALAEAKRLIRDVVGRRIDDELVRDTASRIAAIRASDEGREGIASFLEKRKPNWHPEA